MENTNSDFKVKFPIAFKLMLIIGFILIASLGVVTFLVNYFDSQDARLKGEDTNFSVNKSMASAAENFFIQSKSSAQLFMDFLSTLDSGRNAKKQAAEYFFERNQDLGAVALLSFGKDSFFFDEKIISRKFLQKHELEESQLDALFENESASLRKASSNEEFVINTTGYLGFASAAVTVPWHENGKNQALVFLTSTEKISDNLGGGSARKSHTSFIVNAKGDIIVHPDFSVMQKTENVAKSVFFKKMNDFNDSGRQFGFRNKDGYEYIIAYQRLSLGGLCALTTIKTQSIYESTKSLTKRNIFLMLAILFLALLLVYLYSKTISNPLKALTKASKEIGSGNFDITVRSKSSDEIGVLSKTFSEMSRGLSEGNGGMNFSRATSGGSAEIAGEKKSVTSFFSSIRNFNAISQLLSPEETVTLLNDYMTKTGECVSRTKGCVSNIVGESLMASWGAPATTGSPAMDALNSVVTALLLRSAVIELNKELTGQKKPAIRTGCGINSGNAIAGQLGKAGYMVMGESVNLASQAEALNKQYGTDILITENTYKLISKLVTVEEMPSVSVHGRAEPVKIYAVVNMPKAKNIPGAGANGPATLDEVRKILGIPKPDLSKVNANAEEKK